MSSNSPTSESPVEFFMAFTPGVLCWQHVEQSLFGIFHAMFSSQDLLPQSSAIYYSQDSFGSKLHVVNATAKVVLSVEQLIAWQALGRSMVEASKERNVLAHFGAASRSRANSLDEVVLAPAPLVPVALRRSRSKVYDAAECQRLANEFTELAERLDLFAHTLSAPAV